MYTSQWCAHSRPLACGAETVSTRGLTRARRFITTQSNRMRHPCMLPGTPFPHLAKRRRHMPYLSQIPSPSACSPMYALKPLMCSTLIPIHLPPVRYVVIRNGRRVVMYVVNTCETLQPPPEQRCADGICSVPLVVVVLEHQAAVHARLVLGVVLHTAGPRGGVRHVGWGYGRAGRASLSSRDRKARVKPTPRGS